MTDFGPIDLTNVEPDSLEGTWVTERQKLKQEIEQLTAELKAEQDASINIRQSLVRTIDRHKAAIDHWKVAEGLWDKDRVEALEADNEKLQRLRARLLHSEKQKGEWIHEYFLELQAENEKLRAALRGVLACCQEPHGLGDPGRLCAINTIARIALEKKS